MSGKRNGSPLTIHKSSTVQMKGSVGLLLPEPLILSREMFDAVHLVDPMVIRSMGMSVEDSLGAFVDYVARNSKIVEMGHPLDAMNSASTPASKNAD